MILLQKIFGFHLADYTGNEMRKFGKNSCFTALCISHLLNLHAILPVVINNVW
jgi:hypothetical protein